MAVYTTDPGVCAIDKQAIPKEDAGGKGYKSPLPWETRIGERYTFQALCKEHYLQAYAQAYPEAALPNL